MLKEKNTWRNGDIQANYYKDELKAAQEATEINPQLKKTIKPSEMPWEDTPHGRIKHIVNEKMGTRMNCIDAYIQELLPGGRSGKHRHMAEEYLFILEGEGYDYHWDVDPEIKDEYNWKISETADKWEWEETDCVYIPPYTVHQHFNKSKEKPARFISARNRVYHHIGFKDLEQLENAPTEPH